MSYYKQNVPPVRDQRLTIGDSFSGNTSEMLDCARGGCMLRKNRKFWQTNSCQMALTLMMAATVENAAIVMHGPIGCGAQLHSLSVQVKKGKAQRGKKPAAPVWLSTNLQESDVIGGGERKLKETVLYADREFRPEIIFVISTCAPNIIGDDVEEVVRQTQQEMAANVVSLHCPGFKTRVVASAYDTFYHGLLRHLSFDPVPYKDYTPVLSGNPEYELAVQRYEWKKSRRINLFNATSIGPADEEELVRLLNALGLSVQVYAEYSNADEMRNLSQAALNVSMCNVHDDYMLSYLEERYGMPYIISGMPLGFQATREWLLAIAGHFDLTEAAIFLIEQEEGKTRQAISSYLPKLKGKSVLIGGGVVRVAAEALLLKELGMEVVAVRAYHYDDGAEPVFDQVAKELPAVPVSVSNQLFELVNQVRTYQPDLVISHAGTQGWLAKLGATSIQLFDTSRSYFGYHGLFQLVQRIQFAFENTSYQERLSQHVEFPYKADWYEKDAFSYIKE